MNKIDSAFKKVFESISRYGVNSKNELIEAIEQQKQEIVKLEEEYGKVNAAYYSIKQPANPDPAFIEQRQKAYQLIQESRIELDREKATLGELEKSFVKLSEAQAKSNNEQKLDKIDSYRSQIMQLTEAKGNAKLIKQIEENRDIEVRNAYTDNQLKIIEFDKNIALKKTELSKKNYLWEADYQKEILEIQWQAAEKTLSGLKKMYATTRTDELANEIKQVKLQIGELNQSLEKIPVQKFQEMLSGLKQVTGALGKLGREAGEIFQALGNSMDSINSSLDFAQKEGKTTSDYMGQVATVISSTIEIINMVSAATAKRHQVEKEFYQNQIALAHEYALALNEVLRTQSEMSGSGFVTDYTGMLIGLEIILLLQQ